MYSSVIYFQFLCLLFVNTALQCLFGLLKVFFYLHIDLTQNYSFVSKNIHLFACTLNACSHMKSFELSVNQNKSYLKSIIMKFSSSMLYGVFDIKIDRKKTFRLDI